MFRIGIGPNGKYGMIKKKGNFFERHVEKIVLGVSGVLSVWLLWVFVLCGPFGEEISGQKFGPGEIDRHISRQAADLEDMLNAKSEIVPYTQKREKAFVAKFDCSIAGVPDFAVPMPGVGDIRQLDSQRVYRMPDMGSAVDVAAAVVRGVAHIPLEEVGPEKLYESVSTELSDMDLVTVEAKFDVESLFRNFRQSFAGTKVTKIEWREEDYARAVFASVELQRRHLSEGGQWGDWQVIPQTRINHLAKKLYVEQELDQLKYGIEYARTTFSSSEMRRAILQPEPYNFVSLGDGWLSPALYIEYIRLQSEERKKAERERMLELREERERELQERRNRSESTARRLPTGGVGGSRTPVRPVPRTTRLAPVPRRPLPGDRFGSRPAAAIEVERTIEVVLKDFEALKISETTMLENLRGLLTFWAHDDTVVTGESYQYRIRIGVFNPIAGRDWFRQDEEHLKDDVILWSSYSDVTETVTVDPMLYIFPVATTRDSGGVKVEIAKYHFGRWRSEQFEVWPGESIGMAIEVEKEGSFAARLPGSAGIRTAEFEEIDFTTGRLLVDVIGRAQWQGTHSLQFREFFEMLYTMDGVNIEHLAVTSRFWPRDLLADFKKVEVAQELEVVGFSETGRSGASGGGTFAPTRGYSGGGGGSDDY